MHRRPGCDHPRRDDSGRPYSTFTYHPISQWAATMFGNKMYAQHMLYHVSDEVKQAREDGKVYDIQHGETWDKMVLKDNRFTEEPRNIAGALCTDGITPFKDKMGFSIWPIFFTPYNVPQSLRYKMGITTLLGIVRGKRDKKADQDLYYVLEIVRDELNYLDVFGHEVWDAATNTTFTLRIKLIQLISDYRGLGKLVNMPLSPAVYACLFCWLEGFKIQGKTIYEGSWRSLPAGHWLREICCRLNVSDVTPHRPKRSNIGKPTISWQLVRLA
jgi:Transposase family tnp2